MNQKLYIGVDGCKSGWITAILDEGLRLECHKSVKDLIDTYPEFDAFLIDMVIGLRDSAEQRRPDDLARKELKQRGSTIFPAPSRAAVYKDTYEEQKEANIKVLGKSLSKQSSAIIPKIREIDEYLMEHPEYRNKIDESHPELCFARLKGEVLQSKKKDTDGIEERVGIIARCIPGIQIPDINEKARELKCNVDDLVDAICLAVTAKLKSLGMCETIPERSDVDANGLLMKLTVPKKSVSDKNTSFERKNMVILLVRYKCKTGCRDMFYEAIKNNYIDEMSRSENGNIRYEYAYGIVEDELILTEIWKNENAFELHKNMDHFKRLGDIKKEFVEETEIMMFEGSRSC